MKKENVTGLEDCKTLGVTLLQLMGILIVVGIVVTVALKYFFA